MTWKKVINGLAQCAGHFCTEIVEAIKSYERNPKNDQMIMDKGYTQCDSINSNLIELLSHHWI
jgi:hypothetical protein